jgi:hypothetical protein
MTASKRCPCGCGKTLHRYNGRRTLVCYTIWRQVPQRERNLIMLPGYYSARKRLAAARFVFGLARKIRAGRVEQKLL